MSRLRIGLNTPLPGFSAPTDLVAVVRPAAGPTRFVPVPIGPSASHAGVELPDGPTLVELRLPNGRVLRQQVTMEPGSDQAIDFELTTSVPDWLRLATLVSPRVARQEPRSTKMYQQSLRPAAESSTLDLVADDAPAPWTTSIPRVQVARARSGVLASLVEVGPTAAARVGVLSVDADDDGLSLQFGGELDGSIPVVFAHVPKSNGRSVCATMVPAPWGDGGAVVQYLLNPAAPSQLGASVDVDVVVHDPEFAPLVAYLRGGDVESARTLMPLIQRQATEMLYLKRRNPYAAAAGAYIMLRLGSRTERLSWTYNLWTDFAWLPDGAIAHAAHLLAAYRDEDQSALREAREALVAAAHAGPPVFTAGVRWLGDGLAELQSSRWFRDDADVAAARSYARDLAFKARPDTLCTSLWLNDVALPAFPSSGATSVPNQSGRTA